MKHVMQDNQIHHLRRVHLRAFARLQNIHEAISSGCCPSVLDLSESLERNVRTIKRDLKALREDFKAPLVYDRQRKGFRYAEPGWQLPPARVRRLAQSNQPQSVMLPLMPEGVEHESSPPWLAGHSSPAA
jgi:hypothetical protein